LLFSRIAATKLAARPDWVTSGAASGGSSAVLFRKTDVGNAKAQAVSTKQQQVIDLLSRKGGAALDEMSTRANWLPHSTRAFLTGLKKKGFVITSDKVDGVRRYRAEQKAAQ
jgi:Protein of unknown function (DUF3489)